MRVASSLSHIPSRRLTLKSLVQPQTVAAPDTRTTGVTFPLARLWLSRAHNGEEAHPRLQLRWYMLAWVGMTWLASMLILASNFGLDSFGSDDIPAPPHQAPWNALIFSGLMLLHAYLHWFALSGPRWRTWYPLYALAQGILVCVICVIVVIVPKVGNGLFLPLSLLLALVVEAAALLERARPVMLAALWFVALFVIYAMKDYRSTLDVLFL